MVTYHHDLHGIKVLTYVVRVDDCRVEAGINKGGLYLPQPIGGYLWSALAVNLRLRRCYPAPDPLGNPEGRARCHEAQELVVMMICHHASVSRYHYVKRHALLTSSSRHITMVWAINSDKTSLAFSM